MYAEVIVLTYQSPKIDFYTYQIPKELEGEVKIGQLVAVLFGNRNPMGIILSIDNRPPTIVKNIKPISSILLEKPILLPYQIELLKFMSSYYMAPMINCLNAMLPEIPKRLSNYQQSPISNLPRRQAGHQSIQTLVLVPSINNLPQTLAQFPQAKNHTVYTNELKTSEKFVTWQKILSGSYDFIFGSRLAILTPCPNLKKIIIFDEHDSAYKDERSPYFDTLTIAEKISALTGAKIEIIDSSPRVTTFYSSISHSKRSEESRSFSLRLQDDRLRKVQTKIISLINDRKLGNYSQISLVLEEIIKRAYAKKLSILLFLNKKIESGSIYCKNCKHQEYALSQPDTCPNCKSTEIFFNSSNINSLTKEVKKILPDAQINLIAESLNQLPETSNLQPAITITTSSVFYKLMTKKYDLTAHIYTDSPLNFNEYGASEKIYTQIVNLKKLTRKLLVIQTYNEELPAIKFAAAGNFEAFYKSEIAQRKTLNYPPFALLIKITVTSKKKNPTEQKIEDYKNKLEKLLTTHFSLPTTILGPYKPAFQKALSYNITLKIPLNNYSLISRRNALVQLRPLIPRSKDVKIIVDPKNLNQ